MPRLCDRAFNLLVAEIRRICGTDPLQQVRQEIVIRRLERFRQLEGPPLSQAELREAIVDILPEFRESVLRQAARANQGPATRRRLGCLGATALGLVGLTGGVWLLNLPYPMIRWPVAKTVPLVLLPSFIRMDRDYRQTVSLVAQADQLVNSATSAQDIDLGSDKVAQAQQHLNGLPVWFMGYYPQTYCTFFGCRWRFTLDEFQSARAAVGRMEARVFQEKNAQTLLLTASTAVETAKQRYQAAANAVDQSAALSAWQAGIDQLNEIPPETLAGRMAQTKLTAYRRDYEQLAGTVAGGSRTNTLIGAAQAFALTAAQAGQNPPHNAATWQRTADLWKTAIARLEQVPIEDPGYSQAQVLLATYSNNLGIVEAKVEAEKTSAQALAEAESKSASLMARNLEAMAPNQIASEFQAIINDLNRVQPGTTVEPQAKELLRYAEEKLKQLNP